MSCYAWACLTQRMAATGNGSIPFAADAGWKIIVPGTVVRAGIARIGESGIVAHAGNAGTV